MPVNYPHLDLGNDHITSGTGPATLMVGDHGSLLVVTAISENVFQDHNFTVAAAASAAYSKGKKHLDARLKKFHDVMPKKDENEFSTQMADRYKDDYHPELSMPPYVAEEVKNMMWNFTTYTGSDTILSNSRDHKTYIGGEAPRVLQCSSNIVIGDYGWVVVRDEADKLPAKRALQHFEQMYVKDIEDVQSYDLQCNCHATLLYRNAIEHMLETEPSTVPVFGGDTIKTYRGDYVVPFSQWVTFVKGVDKFPPYENTYSSHLSADKQVLDFSTLQKTVLFGFCLPPPSPLSLSLSIYLSISAAPSPSPSLLVHAHTHTR